MTKPIIGASHQPSAFQAPTLSRAGGIALKVTLAVLALFSNLGAAEASCSEEYAFMSHPKYVIRYNLFACSQRDAVADYIWNKQADCPNDVVITLFNRSTDNTALWNGYLTCEEPWLQKHVDVRDPKGHIGCLEKDESPFRPEFVVRHYNLSDCTPRELFDVPDRIREKQEDCPEGIITESFEQSTSRIINTISCSLYNKNPQKVFSDNIKRSLAKEVLRDRMRSSYLVKT